jgi:hypothetical protein
MYLRYLIKDPTSAFSGKYEGVLPRSRCMSCISHPTANIALVYMHYTWTCSGFDEDRLLKILERAFFDVYPEKERIKKVKERISYITGP